MLENDSGVGNEGPKVVRFQAGVALEVLEEGRLVCVVVRVCGFLESASNPFMLATL